MVPITVRRSAFASAHFTPSWACHGPSPSLRAARSYSAAPASLLGSTDAGEDLSRRSASAALG